MLLIVESGGTKTDWLLVRNPTYQKSFQTSGLSPSIISWQQIEAILKDEVAPWLANEKPRSLIFFGAGLGREGFPDRMSKTLLDNLDLEVEPRVETDILGAAYACLGALPGIVNIMGTGSVAFRFNGEDVVQQSGGWGYLLGDEGGGSSLGRRFLRSLMSDNLPQEVKNAYTAWSGRTPEETLRCLYREPRPGIFLARQVPFLAENINDPVILDLVQAEIRHFFDLYLEPLLPETGQLVFMGGVARIFHEQVMQECRARRLERSRVLTESPVVSIANYLLGRPLDS